MPTTSPPRSVAVLDSAVTWTHSCLQLARASPMSLPTPCSAWDLGQLLAHMDESLVAIGEAAELGHVEVGPQLLQPQPRPLQSRPPQPGPPQPRPQEPGQLVDRIVQRACRTLAAWQQRLTSAPVGVGDLALGRDTVALVGALEIAVHGWDVATATGQGRRLPEDLAARLYDVALAVVTPDERGKYFGPAVSVSASALAGTRLLAHLGRTEL